MNISQVKNIHGIILDMDGVLWHDTAAIGDLPRIFSAIQQRGLQVILATNNATRTIAQYVEKLAGFGVHLKPEQIINTAETVAVYLSLRYPAGGRVYVVGEQALIDTLAAANFIHSDQTPIAVVAGLDRDLTYEKLKKASLFIQAGSLFLATNTDNSLPTPQGFIPGAGAVVGAIQIAARVDPVIIGKPSPEMYQQALNRMGLTASETLVVGDRLETDIAGAQKLGCLTALVLSGVTTEAQLRSYNPQPDFVARDLSELLDLDIVNG